MERRMARMQELVRAVREVRNRYQVDPQVRLDVSVRCEDAVAGDFRLLAPFITTLAGVGQLDCGPTVRKPAQAATFVNPEFEAYSSLKGLIDEAAETKRLEKQLAEKQKALQSAEAKLANANFTGKAPPEVVQQQRDLVADLKNQIKIIMDNLRDLRRE
jgi:valyl-tRNA synthetase